jgi:hypothetical protein
MTAKDMQYDVRMKLNKLDSQKYRELRPQEVDWILWESQLLTIKKYHETFQHDKIKEIVIANRVLTTSNHQLDTTFASLPMDFLHYISGYVWIAKRGCVNIISSNLITEISVTEYNPVTDMLEAALPPTPPEATTSFCNTVQIPGGLTDTKEIDIVANCGRRIKGTIVRADLLPKQHVEIHRDSSLDVSSFEWRQVNYNFAGNNMILYLDGTFFIYEPIITYVRKPKRIVSLPSYQLPNGDVVTYQDCELHESLHNEIVDLAVFIASTNLQMKDIQLKQNKVKLN